MEFLSLAGSLIEKVLSDNGCKRKAEPDLRPEAKRRKFDYQISITGNTALIGLDRPTGSSIGVLALWAGAQGREGQAELQVIRSQEDILNSYCLFSSTTDIKGLRATLDSLERVTAIAKAKLEALETSKSDSASQAEFQAEAKCPVDEETSADDEQVLE
jgi:hypothetical protein